MSPAQQRAKHVVSSDVQTASPAEPNGFKLKDQNSTSVESKLVEINIRWQSDKKPHPWELNPPGSHKIKIPTSRSQGSYTTRPTQEHLKKSRERKFKLPKSQHQHTSRKTGSPQNQQETSTIDLQQKVWQSEKTQNQAADRFREQSSASS